MAPRPFRVLATLLFASLLAGCGGWHIRGTEGAALAVEAVTLRAPQAPNLYNALVRRLEEFDVARVAVLAEADAGIELTAEEFERRVRSVDPNTGKVREIELVLTAMLTVVDSAGNVALGPERVQWQRDYVFDEVSLLGTVSQEDLLRLDLADDAALTILLRLESLDLE